MQKDLFEVADELAGILKGDYVGSGQSFQGAKSLWALYWKFAEHSRILFEGHNNLKE